MAKFSTHLYGGAAVSSAGALAVYGLGWTDPAQTQMLYFAGVASSLLPDIDSDNSAPVRGFFTLLGVFLAFMVSIAVADKLLLMELLSLWAGTYVAVRYGLFQAFARFTVHRGIWHSWLAAGFAALAAVNGAFHLSGFSPWESWLAGLFVALGYLTHLFLDEIASVDLLGSRVKRSFGTALKPFSASAPMASAAMFLGAVVLAYMAPTVDPVLAMADRLRSDGFPVSFQSVPHAQSGEFSLTRLLTF